MSNSSKILDEELDNLPARRATIWRIWLKTLAPSIFLLFLYFRDLENNNVRTLTGSF